VDAKKPSPQEFMDTHELASKDSLDFIRGYEAEIAGLIEVALADATRWQTASRPRGPLRVVQ
jgi:hypothetical protein